MVSKFLSGTREEGNRQKEKKLVYPFKWFRVIKFTELVDQQIHLSDNWENECINEDGVIWLKALENLKYRAFLAALSQTMPPDLRAHLLFKQDGLLFRVWLKCTGLAATQFAVTSHQTLRGSPLPLKQARLSSLQSRNPGRKTFSEVSVCSALSTFASNWGSVVWSLSFHAST